jgi:phospholipase C
MHAGDNDFVDGDGVEKQSHLYTIWDALAEKNLEGRYYYGNLPFVGLWRNPGYMTFSRPLEDFFIDAALGNLAPLTFIDPIYESGAPNALSNDDHPHSDVRAGQFLLSRVYDAVRNGPKWGKTLLIINYDEWGGFFEHIVPPVMPPSDVDYATWQNDGLLGFRVPGLLIGPRAKRATVNHDLLEPNAILNFISWRFGLRQVGSRSQFAGNLATALDWDHAPNLASRGYAVPAGVFGTDCERYSSYPQLDPPLPDPNPLPQPPAVPQDDDHLQKMRGLYDLARGMGFWVGPTGFE